MKKIRKILKRPFNGAGMILWYKDANNHINVLLEKRSHRVGVYVHKWSIITGRKEKYDKSFLEAAIRETKEEVGISKGYSNPKRIEYTNLHFYHFETFAAEIPSGNIPEVYVQRSEVVEAKWFDLNHLPKEVCFPAKIQLLLLRVHLRAWK